MVTQERSKQERMVDTSLQKEDVALEQRTPEEIAATRARIFAMSRTPRPLPPGKTLEDVIVGQWPGDETDEEFQSLMDDLS